MPRYVYRCDDCQAEFLIFHAMKETLQICQACGVENNLHRIPQLTAPLPKKRVEKQKVGTVVNEYIESTKSELKKERQEAGKEEYKP